MALVTLADIVTYTRDRLRESSENAWSDLQVVRAINERLEKASRVIKVKRSTWLHAEVTITYVADQATYTLPVDFWGLLSYPLRTDLSPDSAIGWVPFNEHHRYLGFSFTWNGEKYTFQGSDQNKKLLIIPTPASSGNTLKLHYIRKPAALTSGLAKAGTATSLTLADAPAYGVSDVRDDYYNNTDFFLSAGTGVGETATATDFAGSTAIVTINFTATPTGTSAYNVLPPWAEDYNYLLAYGAAATLLDDLQIPNDFEMEYDKYIQLMITSMDLSQAPKYVMLGDLDRYR